MTIKRHISGFLLGLFSLILAPAGLAQNIRPMGGNTPFNPYNQNQHEGSHWAEEDSVVKEDVPIGIYGWKIDERFGDIITAQPDTLPHLFPPDAFTSGRFGHYNYTGNLGAPRQSRIYTDRYTRGFEQPFIFAQPYDFFLTAPQDLFFTNTKSPFMNITYHECGNKQNGEDRIRALFAINAGKRLGFGFKLDYLYGRGYYTSQASSQFNATLYGSYRSDKYTLHAMYYTNHLKNSENGGIESETYVTRPETFPTTYAPADMPTRLSKTWNKLNVNTFYLTHRYNLGFHRYRDEKGNLVSSDTVKMRNKLLAKAVSAKDTLRTDSAHAAQPTLAAAAQKKDSTAIHRAEFVPVAGIVHTLRFDHNDRLFLSNLRENASNSTFFGDFFLPGDSANDKTKFHHLENTLAFEIKEGFNKWVKSGLRLFARHDYYRYSLPTKERTVENFNENHFSVGAQLLKEQGTWFHYNVLGELRTTGEDWGEFNVDGRASLNVPLKRDTLHISLNGHLRNELPSFYYRHYHARNAWWDNGSLDKVLRTGIGGEIRYRRTRLGVNLESIQNLAYFQEYQSPFEGTDGVKLARYGVGVKQSAKNIQVITATLGQDFKWGILNWENELTAQVTSDKDIMPLPAFSAYSNLYILFNIAKVLRTELGADVRYFTEYYAPAYSPIIGQYALQDRAERIKIGNYPSVNVYANFHLKQTRFYLMASHVNYSGGAGRPFLVPNYPLNRMVVRLGISWNFNN